MAEMTDYTKVWPFRLLPSLYRRDFEPTRQQLAAFEKYAFVGDPEADALVAAIKSSEGQNIRAQFERALTEGIDAVPDAHPALRDFFASAEEVPFWVDREKLDRASELFSGLGPAAAPLLMVGLAITFTTPDGNAVLLRSGDTRDRAGRRATETLSWVQEVTAPGALAIGAQGYQSSVRVRLTHAFMRAGFMKRGDWDNPHLAVNQQVFSNVIIAFAAYPTVAGFVCGQPFNRRDREAIFHLWRYVGYLVGVNQNLLLTDEHDAMRLFWLFFRTVIKPDQSATELGSALIAAYPEIYGITSDSSRDRLARWLVLQSHTALARVSIGTDLSDWLGFPKLNPAIVPVVGAYSGLYGLTTLLDAVPPARRARRKAMRKVQNRLLDAMRENTSASVLATLTRPVDDAPRAATAIEVEA
ncbi:MAG: DUF2236 domain-containing protein [Solirubrobacterales bacterium]|nr:DUF2236 domain-containing protein [Solirubrobacterales bacterium]